jgi:hypothetical protein
MTAAWMVSEAVPTRLAQTPPTHAEAKRAGIITIEGCLQREHDILRTAKLGAADEYVLTFTKLTSGDIRFKEQPGPHGIVCRLSGQGESGFAQYVGHRMQITGFITNRKSVTTVVTDAGDAKPDAQHPPELPKVNVSAFRELSSECQPTP